MDKFRTVNTSDYYKWYNFQGHFEVQMRNDIDISSYSLEFLNHDLRIKGK